MATPHFDCSSRTRNYANSIESAVCTQLFMLANSEKKRSLEEIAEWLKKDRAAEHGGNKRRKYPPQHYCDIYIQPASEGGKRMLVVGYQVSLRGQTLSLTERQPSSETQDPISVQCPLCYGTGDLDDQICRNCDGSGQLEDDPDYEPGEEEYCKACGRQLEDDGECNHCLNYPRCPKCGNELDDDGNCPINDGRCKQSTWPQNPLL